jgi:hypothetical protein
MAIGEVDGVEAASQHSFRGLHCCCRIWFAEEQTANNMGNWWDPGGRLVSYLRAEIQPPKDGVGMIIMVDE